MDMVQQFAVRFMVKDLNSACTREKLVFWFGFETEDLT